MEKLTQIDQLCKDHNHELIKRYIDSVEAEELKREIFLKIITYFEEEEGQFPMGYSMLFIEWLLKNQDVDTARDYFVKLNRLGVANGRMSELIYEYIIEPDETQYRERYNNNLELLNKNKVLFSKCKFDFDDIKKDILTIANFQDKYFVGEGRSRLLIVNTLDVEQIQELLDMDRCIYLVYDDLKKFYYLLLFEDFSRLKKYIE